jgi:hypothetical protein
MPPNFRRLAAAGEGVPDRPAGAHQPAAELAGVDRVVLARLRRQRPVALPAGQPRLDGEVRVGQRGDPAAVQQLAEARRQRAQVAGRAAAGSQGVLEV